MSEDQAKKTIWTTVISSLIIQVICAVVIVWGFVVKIEAHAAANSNLIKSNANRIEKLADEKVCKETNEIQVNAIMERLKRMETTLDKIDNKVDRMSKY